MITRLRNKAFKCLGISLLLFVLSIVLIGLRASGFPEMIFAVGMVLLITFTFIFYVQGNIALAQARGYDGSAVAAIIIVAAFCFGFLFFAMPLIVLSLKDKVPKKRRSHSNESESGHRNPPAILPPRRDQKEKFTEPTAALPQTNMVDPETIYFSLATINDALPAIDTSAKPGAKDLVLHEDDWRQFEAISRSFDREIKDEIEDVQRIFKEKSEVSGEHRLFKGTHIRKRIVHPLSTPILWTNLLSAAGVQTSLVSGVALNEQGMVRSGFSFPVAQLSIFGIRHNDNVEVLCFDLTRTPGLSEPEAERLATFLENSGVTFVHWPSATVFTDKQMMVKFLVQKNKTTE